MNSTTTDIESSGIRLQLLISVRWIAIIGQAAALAFVGLYLGVELSAIAAFALVGASALLNILLLANYRRNARLSNTGSALCLFFDSLQLAGLLYLTGGLENPFAVLLLVPVTISATHLSGKSSLLLGAGTLCSITLLALYHQPLPLPAGSYQLSGIYLLAIWTSLILGTVFLAGYAWLIAADSRRVIDALSAARLALAREQQLSAVGGIAAAAAHELGTPLNTILLVAKDLISDLDADSPLLDDAELLYDQAQICKRVLAQISKKSAEGSMEPLSNHFDFLPLPAIFTMIVDKQNPGGKNIEIITPQDAPPPPTVAPTAEFLHGLGNFVSNAVEFSHSHVKIRLDWTDHEITVKIEDDGPGFSPDILNRIGEPYNSSRAGNGGMGLGIFIAKTLLARTGADISIFNGKEGGARVKIVWPRAQLENRMSESQSKSSRAE